MKPKPTHQMNSYIVLFEDSEENENLTRSNFISKICDRNESFRNKLNKILKEKNLMEEVWAQGIPLSLPIFTLSCTSQVAKLIESLPEVSEVIEDIDDLSVCHSG